MFHAHKSIYSAFFRRVLCTLCIFKKLVNSKSLLCHGFFVLEFNLLYIFDFLIHTNLKSEIQISKFEIKSKS